MVRRNWTREETILAMDLYTRMPFSKIGKNNPEIVKLARIVNRTPDAVAYKMSNIAHYDQSWRQEIYSDYLIKVK